MMIAMKTNDKAHVTFHFIIYLPVLITPGVSSQNQLLKSINWFHIQFHVILFFLFFLVLVFVCKMKFEVFLFIGLAAVETWCQVVGEGDTYSMDTQHLPNDNQYQPHQHLHHHHPHHHHQPQRQPQEQEQRQYQRPQNENVQDFGFGPSFFDGNRHEIEPLVSPTSWFENQFPQHQQQQRQQHRQHQPSFRPAMMPGYHQPVQPSEAPPMIQPIDGEKTKFVAGELFLPNFVVKQSAPFVPVVNENVQQPKVPMAKSSSNHYTNPNNRHQFKSARQQQVDPSMPVTLPNKIINIPSIDTIAYQKFPSLPQKYHPEIPFVPSLVQQQIVPDHVQQKQEPVVPTIEEQLHDDGNWPEIVNFGPNRPNDDSRQLITCNGRNFVIGVADIGHVKCCGMMAYKWRVTKCDNGNLVDANPPPSLETPATLAPDAPKYRTRSPYINYEMRRTTKISNGYIPFIQPDALPGAMIAAYQRKEEAMHKTTAVPTTIASTTMAPTTTTDMALQVAEGEIIEEPDDYNSITFENPELVRMRQSIAADDDDDKSESYIVDVKDEEFDERISKPIVEPGITMVRCNKQDWPISEPIGTYVCCGDMLHYTLLETVVCDGQIHTPTLLTQKQYHHSEHSDEKQQQLQQREVENQPELFDTVHRQRAPKRLNPHLLDLEKPVATSQLCENVADTSKFCCGNNLYDKEFGQVCCEGNYGISRAGKINCCGAQLFDIGSHVVLFLFNNFFSSHQSKFIILFFFLTGMQRKSTSGIETKTPHHLLQSMKWRKQFKM